MSNEVVVVPQGLHLACDGATVSRRAIVVSARVAAPPADVFAAWTSTEAITAWFVDEARVELRIGGPFEVLFLPDTEPERGSEGCRILTFVPDELLAFTWNAPPQYPELRPARTWCVVRFEAIDDGTRVTLTHTGWPDAGFDDGSRWPEVFAYFERAWPMVMKALVGHLGAA